MAVKFRMILEMGNRIYGIIKKYNVYMCNNERVFFAMKIKTRLGIAFLTVTLVPMMLIYLAFSILSNYQMRAFRESHGLTEPVDLLSGNTIQIFNRLTQNNQQAIQKKLEEDPDSFADMAYLDTINQELKAKYAYLIVRRGDEFI